ncbi:MAG TPA: AraC family transcriptional regulator [Sphingobium sp.]|nr:AraC family transcriptional regulator [Sphingobium sp.]
MLPLANYKLVESQDIASFGSFVRSELGDASFTRVRSTDQFDAHFHAYPLDLGGVYFVEYGSSVIIEPYHQGIYTVHIPLDCEARISVGTKKYVSTPEQASLLQPGDRSSIVIGGGTQHLILKIDAGAARRILRGSIDRVPVTPIHFDHSMDLTKACGRIFHQTLLLMVDAIDAADRSSPVALKEFEDLLLSQLLMAQPNNYSDELHFRSPSRVPAEILRAVDFIQRNAHESLTIDDIADAAGVRSRSLQEGFRQTYDMTPMEFLREVRLNHVRSALLEADHRRTTVTQIAFDWGFQHLGRFSSQYRHRFGETPLQTLKSTNGDASLKDRHPAPFVRQ